MRYLRPLVFAIVGGLVVAGAFLALGVTGRRTTHTVVAEGPVDAQPSRSAQRLTAHALYMRDAPGVVYISSRTSRPVRNPLAVSPARAGGLTTGSGFLLDGAGFILTTYDVVEGADPDDGVKVAFGDGTSLPAQVLATEPSEDIALLRVDARHVPPVTPLPLGDSSTVRVGDPALAIANPLGADRTLTSGIVSALQRELPGPDGAPVANVIETEMPVYPGSSGGPLLDADGRVIGINSQMRSPATGDGRSQIALAIPIDTAKPLLAQAGATNH